MKVFDKELDSLEESVVYLALAFFIATSLEVFFGRLIPFLALLIRFGASLCFIAGAVAGLLWILRYFGSPLYARFAKPERNKLQGLLTDREQAKDSQ
jgi:hypothetical protein